MNREDIIHMGHEAGFIPEVTYEMAEELEQFATLVVANIDPKSSMAWQEGYEAGVVAEREACAKVAQETVCSKHILTGYEVYGTKAAKAIRARGKNT